MEPFKINEALAALKDAYPDPSLLLKATKEGRRSRESITRLWMSEGIPFAFRECPALYEEIRCWLGWQLGVSPKYISMTGSARLGISLAPKKFGKEFSSKSDLDLFVVCKKLFASATKDFQSWQQDYNKGRVTPKTDNERAYWDQNLTVCPNNIGKGFIDTNKIPNREQYSTASKISQRMWALTKKLKITPGAPTPERASIRCYRDWDSAVDQISLNLSLMTHWP